LPFDPWALPTAIKFHAFGVMVARKKGRMNGKLARLRDTLVAFFLLSY